MDKDFISENIRDLQIVDDLDEETINKYFEISNSYMEEIYQFVLLYYDYMYTKKDSGDQMKKSMLEDHLLTDIHDNPGITTTELAEKWHRTTSSISQTISKLVNAGLVDRVLNVDNRKIYNLYITDSGKNSVLHHKFYDVKDTVKSIRKLLHSVSIDELNAFFKVVKAYNLILKSNKKKRS